MSHDDKTDPEQLGLLVVVSCRDVYANAYFVKLCFFLFPEAN